MIAHIFSFLAFCVSLAYSGTACTGGSGSKTFNGLPCATTTRYWDGQKGACGCGSGSTCYDWQWQLFTGAASSSVFGGGTWCGSGCGSCYQLCPTCVGCSPGGGGAPSTTCITIMVTNLCPANGNEQWCSVPNQYGYGAHFDLMDHNMNGIISAMGWDNPEVTYQQVGCGGGGSPSSGDYGMCQCAK
eukprot:TRINITY_DN812_c0_g1_i1.p1 TRINITY_DN812_c0_g1~~TRINITY_DN812_c0_g1_i1.p1  ORF type:complete len:187 (+),score=35.83 TRINITY_DN812_c0_g1_i1:49-609(+)